MNTNTALRKRKDEHDSDGGDTAVLDPKVETPAASETDQEGDGADSLPSTPREILSLVKDVTPTITGCTENELKNFQHTADFVIHSLAVRLADKWPIICRTAQRNGKDNEKAAKVAVAVKIEIDHSNILMVDTRLELSLSLGKDKTLDEIQEDLTQEQGHLPLGQ